MPCSIDWAKRLALSLEPMREKMIARSHNERTIYRLSDLFEPLSKFAERSMVRRWSLGKPLTMFELKIFELLKPEWQTQLKVVTLNTAVVVLRSEIPS